MLGEALLLWSQCGLSRSCQHCSLPKNPTSRCGNVKLLRKYADDEAANAVRTHFYAGNRHKETALHNADQEVRTDYDAGHSSVP